MIPPEELPRRYEALADHFARQGESRQRDECLVLAADAALRAGSPEEADRLRKRLLLTNPHHLLRPYASMAEALAANDVRDYVADLRRRWPPEVVEKVLSPLGPGSLPLAKPLKTRQANSAPRAEPLDLPVSAASYWLSMAMLSLGLVVAGGLFVVVFGAPFLDR